MTLDAASRASDTTLSRRLRKMPVDASVLKQPV